MTVNIPANVLIWAVPILIIGFIIGTGILKRFSRTFWLFMLGWSLGVMTLLAIELTFPLESGAVLVYLSARRGLDWLFGARRGDTFTFSLSQPVVVFIVLIGVLIFIASIIDWSPRRKT